MRRFFHAIRLIAVLAGAAAAVLLAVALTAQPVFAQGAYYELYLGTSSGQIVETSHPAIDKLRYPTVGESVRYEGDRLSELCKAYRAEVVFTETAGDVVNYYLYSPMLGAGVFLKEGYINLHIALSHGQTAAGTPLIFGGF